MLSISISFPKFCFGRWRGAQHLCWTLPITQKLLCKGTLVTSSQESPSISRWRRGSTPTHQQQLWKKLQILEWQLLTLTISHCPSKQWQAWKASPKSRFFCGKWSPDSLFIHHESSILASPRPLKLPHWVKLHLQGVMSGEPSSVLLTDRISLLWLQIQLKNLFYALLAIQTQFFFSLTEQVLDCSIGLGVFLGLGWVFFVWLFTFPINICQCLLFPQRSLPWGSAAKLHSYSDLHWSPLN